MSEASEHIDLARRHVASGRLIVARQREVVRRGGLNAAEASKLLAVFETTQAIFEDDLDRLLRKEGERG